MIPGGPRMIWGGSPYDCARIYESGRAPHDSEPGNGAFLGPGNAQKILKNCVSLELAQVLFEEKKRGKGETG